MALPGELLLPVRRAVPLLGFLYLDAWRFAFTSCYTSPQLTGVLTGWRIAEAWILVFSIETRSAAPPPPPCCLRL